MQWADAGVLLLPREFPAPGGSNPELMYRMATGIVTTVDELMLAVYPFSPMHEAMAR